jgi:hypothetical protein
MTEFDKEGFKLCSNAFGKKIVTNYAILLAHRRKKWVIYGYTFNISTVEVFCHHIILSLRNEHSPE